MTYKFKREPESGLIIVNIEIDGKYELKMILDTGATNTTIDSNTLYLLGHDLKIILEQLKLKLQMELLKLKFLRLILLHHLG